MRNWFILLTFLPLVAQSQGLDPWVDFSMGSPALHINLPVQPSPQKPAIPPSVRAYFKKYEGFYLKDQPKGFVVTMMAIDYNPDIPADGRGAINGTNGQWEKNGAKLAILSTVDKVITGKKAVQQRAQLIQGGLTYEIIDVVITEGNKLWQVIIMADSTKPDLRDDIQRVADSLRF